MQATRPEPIIQAPGDRGAALIARLESLRDARRLGIHIWENTNAFQPQRNLRRILKEWDKSVEHLPTFSLSLLPAQQDNLSMEPYECQAYTLGHAGYLFDLREDQLNPPTIIAAHHQAMVSKQDPYDKRVAPKHAATSLDQMASTYAIKNASKDRMAKGHCNEILVQLGLSHACALVIPLNVPNPRAFAGYEALATLTGCLAGLEHAEAEGTCLPVVLYHVTPPGQNGFKFVGETPDALRATATQAINTILHDADLLRYLKHQSITGLIWERIDHYLNIDMNSRIEEREKTGQVR